MSMKQYKVGKSWEDDVMLAYNKQGYSTIKLSTDLEGTVFDIIALKGNKAICIECKHTQSDKLYYESSGLKRKRDEIWNFIGNGNDVVLFVKFENIGTYVANWVEVAPILTEKGYITKDNCIEVRI